MNLSLAFQLQIFFFERLPFCRTFGWVVIYVYRRIKSDPLTLILGAFLHCSIVNYDRWDLLHIPCSVTVDLACNSLGRLAQLVLHMIDSCSVLFNCLYCVKLVILGK